jgi:FkbM family methyltransferase
MFEKRSTKFKMSVARFLYRMLKLLRFRDHQIVRRGGIWFDLDLREGIDLQLFLTGAFQKHVSRCLSQRGVGRKDSLVFVDIGANVGAVSLALLKEFPKARVLCVEPTDFAFKKLRRNIDLNEGFSDRATLVQGFVSDSRSGPEFREVCSSWSLVSDQGEKRHPVHEGVIKSGVSSRYTLDDLLENSDRLDFIKIDTDGHELEVLKGGQAVIRRHRPIVVFEVTVYEMRSQGRGFSEFVNFFATLNYQLFNSATDALVTEQNIERLVPAGGGIDVVAVPCS